MMENVFPLKFRAAAGGLGVDPPHPPPLPSLPQTSGFPSALFSYNRRHLTPNNRLAGTYWTTCRWPTRWASEEPGDGGSVASGCSPPCLDTARSSWCRTGWAQDSRPAGWDRTAAPRRVDLQFNDIKGTHAWVCLQVTSSVFPVQEAGSFRLRWSMEE